MQNMKTAAATIALLVIALTAWFEWHKFGTVLLTTWIAVLCIGFTFAWNLWRRLRTRNPHAQK